MGPAADPPRARRAGPAPTTPAAPIGPYTLQAAIAACHATRRAAADTDWAQIAGLYDVLATAWPSPVVELNRAVAHGHAFGPDAGLALLDAIDATSLTSYPQLPGVRGELLALAGRHDEAADRFTQAAALTRNEPERALFTERAAKARARASDGPRARPARFAGYLGGPAPRRPHRRTARVRPVRGLPAGTPSEKLDPPIYPPTSLDGPLVQ